MLTPEQLVRKARERGLKALGVTDHDTVDAWEETRAAGAAQGIEVISGVELSVTVDEQEVHLLGYFFNPEHPGLRARLAELHEARRTRAQKMIDRLIAMRVPITFEEVYSQAGEGGTLGRPHVAAALVEAGHVSSVQEAFDRYLRDGGPAHVKKPSFPASRALHLLHEAGGLGVLAHPGHWTSGVLIRKLVQAGLDGIEVVHPSHDESLTRYYRELAQGAALIMTGGSDYHGHHAQDDERLGAYYIPYSQLERIRRKAV